MRQSLKIGIACLCAVIVLMIAGSHIHSTYIICESYESAKARYISDCNEIIEDGFQYCRTQGSVPEEQVSCLREKYENCIPCLSEQQSDELIAFMLGHSDGFDDSAEYALMSGLGDRFSLLNATLRHLEICNISYRQFFGRHRCRAKVASLMGFPKKHADLITNLPCMDYEYQDHDHEEPSGHDYHVQEHAQGHAHAHKE